MPITPTFKIDTTELISYISNGGLKWSRNDLDSDDSGRTLDGIMHRSRIATKIKLQVVLDRLSQAEMTTLVNALSPQFVDVTYIDPVGGSVTKTFYGSTVDSTTERYINGDLFWETTTFSLIER